MTEYLGVSPAFLIRKGMYTARKCTSIVRKRHNAKSSMRQLLRFSLIDQAASYPFLPWCGKQKKMNSPESWYGQETLKKGL